VRETAGREPTEQDLAATTKKTMVLRMLHNLLSAAGRKNDTTAALRYLDVILAIDPEMAENRWMRAVVSYQTGRYDVARSDIDWLQNHAPKGINQALVQQLSDLLEDGR
jgi:serine protease Do